MGTYSRLIRLYKNSNLITPLEDFTTEILTGILETDLEFKNNFTENLLGIKHSELQITSQKTYTLDENKFVRIDLVLENRDCLCFLENKVESYESVNQLDNYARVLDKFTSEKKTYLFYCTKYYDPKSEIRHHFKQFRWHQIGKLLKSKPDCLQKNDFFNFLKNYNMASDIELTNKEIFHLQNFRATLSFLDEFMEILKPIFISTFGKFEKDKFSDLRVNDRYVHLKKNVYGNLGSEIGVGVTFEKGEPTAWIWIGTEADNNKREILNELVKKNKEMFNYISEDGCGMYIKLNHFLQYENSLEELENWFTKNMLRMKEFIIMTPELEWKLDYSPSP
jgi:hypothetical protein